MARQPKNLFTKERKAVLEDIMGEFSDLDEIFLNSLGKYAAGELWPQDRYEEINNPDDHTAFLEAIEPLIDPDQLALRGSFLPDEAGGMDLPLPVYMMGLEIISQANPSIALSLAIDGSVLSAVWKLGDGQQRQRYVTDALIDMKMCSFALTEPGYGSDAGNLETKAVLDNDNYIFNGKKNWITNADWADYYFMVVRTNPDKSLGPKGLSVIMTHKDEITSITQMRKYTVPGSFTGELSFADAAVPVEDDGVKRMLGSRDTGFLDAKNLLEGGRVTIAAYGLGIATEAFEMALNYAHERQSRGESLIQKQSLAFRFAEFDTRLDAARLLTYRAAKRLETGTEYAEASKAKLFANDLAQDLALFNIDLHGGYGLSKEFKCMQLFHDAGVGVTGEGTKQIQLTVITSNRKKLIRKDPSYVL